jgi:hypothetical protein
MENHPKTCFETQNIAKYDLENTKSTQLYPYHDRKFQFLQPPDLPRRRRFCGLVLTKLDLPEKKFSICRAHTWTNQNPHPVKGMQFSALIFA